MLDSQWLQILCCPASRQKITEATPEKLRQINQLISQGSLKTPSGELAKESVESLLIREDGKLGYPVHSGIPVMLHSEALILEVS